MFTTLVVVPIASFLSVWGVALHSHCQARYTFVGIPALAGLVALGAERSKLPTRFLLPAMGLIGTLVSDTPDPQSTSQMRTCNEAIHIRAGIGRAR